MDNADERLTPSAIGLGCVRPQRRAQHEMRMRELDRWRRMLRETSVTPNKAAAYGLKLNQDGGRRSAFELLSYPNIELSALRRIWPELAEIDERLAERLATEARYSVYLERQKQDIDSFEREETRRLPHGLAFDTMSGLSNELRQKLAQVRPRNLGPGEPDRRHDARRFGDLGAQCAGGRSGSAFSWRELMRRPPVPPGPSGLKPARVKVPRSKEAEVNLADALRQNRERAVSLA